MLALHKPSYFYGKVLVSLTTPSSSIYTCIDLLYVSISGKLHFVSQLVLVVKNPPANAKDIRDSGWILEYGRSPGGGNGNPLQYSCLEDTNGQRGLAS